MVTVGKQEMGKCMCTSKLAVLHVWLVLGRRLQMHFVSDSTDMLAA